MAAMSTLELVEAGVAVTAAGGMVTGKGPLGSLKPRTPQPPKPPLLQSQSSILQGQQLEEAQASALRRGRASTILTTNASTGDRLGP
jgi:hypothetical protein